MLHKKQLEFVLTEWALIGSKENYEVNLNECLTENDLLVF